MRKIKQSQANSERGFRPSPYKKSSKTQPSPNEVFALRYTWNQGVSKEENPKHQAKSSQVFTRFSPFATPEIKWYHSKKNAQIKQSQGESEWGFVLRPGVILDEINGKITQKSEKSSLTQPSLNEVFALRHAHHSKTSTRARNTIDYDSRQHTKSKSNHYKSNTQCVIINYHPQSLSLTSSYIKEHSNP
jgi:hypothetical protein